MIRMVLALIVLLSPSVSAEDAAFRQVSGSCNLTFPRDHGAHPGYQTEWWYYTGNLEAQDGRRFGFQFTVFRRQLRPVETPLALPGGIRSAWRTNQIYLGHAAISDIAGKHHLQAETLSRGIDMLAGVTQNNAGTRVFLNRWEALIGPDGHRLNVSSKDFDYQFELTPEKAPVRHGQAGYSRKGGTAGRASCYYSFTRLSVSGMLRIHDESLAVSGLGWMDQEFSSAYLEPGLSGWDWLSLQLSDGTEAMIFGLRQANGNLSPASSGTFIDPGGHARHLARTDFSLEPVKTWQSPESEAVYPIRWKIRIHPLDLSLEMNAAFPDQEMETGATTGVTYWEGAVVVSGSRAGHRVTGRGYLEMTGRTGKGFEAPI